MRLADVIVLYLISKTILQQPKYQNVSSNSIDLMPEYILLQVTSNSSHVHEQAENYPNTPSNFKKRDFRRPHDCGLLKEKK